MLADARKAYLIQTIVIMVGIALLFLGLVAWAVGQEDGAGGFGVFLMLLGAGILGVLIIQWMLGLKTRSSALARAVSKAHHVSPAPEPSNRYPCPRCGEPIPVAAHVCRFCSHPIRML